MPIMRIDIEQEQMQVARLQAVRSSRDGAAVSRSLERIRETATSDENLMPAIIDAVESQATLGEISDQLRSVFGEYTGGS